jgi:hypothetical protein
MAAYSILELQTYLHQRNLKKVKDINIANRETLNYYFIFPTEMKKATPIFIEVCGSLFRGKEKNPNIPYTFILLIPILL